MFWKTKAPYIKNDKFTSEFLASSRNYYIMHTFCTSLLFVTNLCFSFWRKSWQ